MLSDRAGLTPPPAIPMLPSRSWIIAIVRMFCADGMLRSAQRARTQERRGFYLLRWFPAMYRTLSGSPLAYRKVIFSTTSGVYVRHAVSTDLDTARVLQCRIIAFGKTVFVQLIVPTGLPYSPLRSRHAGEQTIIEAKIFTHDQGWHWYRLGIHGCIFSLVSRIQHHAHGLGCNVSTRAYVYRNRGHRRGTRKARFEPTISRAVVNFGLSPSGTRP